MGSSLEIQYLWDKGIGFRDYMGPWHVQLAKLLAKKFIKTFAHVICKQDYNVGFPSIRCCYLLTRQQPDSKKEETSTLNRVQHSSLAGHTKTIIERLHMTSRPVKHRFFATRFDRKLYKTLQSVWQKDGRFYYDLRNAGVLKLELPVYHLTLVWEQDGSYT